MTKTINDFFEERAVIACLTHLHSHTLTSQHKYVNLSCSLYICILYVIFLHIDESIYKCQSVCDDLDDQNTELFL